MTDKKHGQIVLRYFQYFSLSALCFLRNLYVVATGTIIANSLMTF
ncbi:hypothetical protein NI35_2077 [Salmonella enterica subsp. enterica serovar Cerro]|nr:hypothetical protein GW13_PRO1089 [Salmonella enterica subsp. enterica serovar Cerro]KMN26189.1 hypothetical protein NI35_2077 [Salmonella enterica subsp. enterica serovar Cerro]